MERLDEISECIRSHLDDKYIAREAALKLSREAIRSSALAIRAIHRDEFEEAQNLLARARSALDRAVQALREHADVLSAGFVDDACKEYAEASTTYALVRDEPLPDPEMLGVRYTAYLNGLGETVGELRRYLLDNLRRGKMEACDRLLQAMDDIYSVLVTMDYPDAMTGGLRRTTDVCRGILEKTRGDVTVAIRQRDLELALREFEARIRKP